MNNEQGILNVEVHEITSTFNIPYSLFDILLLPLQGGIISTIHKASTLYVF